MKLLFAKHALAWPRSSGHDVHTFHMMQACAALGHDVALATVAPPDPAGLAGLPLAALVALDVQRNGNAPFSIPATRLQQKFRAYWGVPDSRVVALAEAARNLRADAVIVSGGENVDPLVVEDALHAHPGAGEVVVVGVPDDEWGSIAVCLYTGTASTEELDQYLRERVPRHYVPKRWVRVDRIPKAALGKPDRAAARRLADG